MHLQHRERQQVLGAGDLLALLVERPGEAFEVGSERISRPVSIAIASICIARPEHQTARNDCVIVFWSTGGAASSTTWPSSSHSVAVRLDGGDAFRMELRAGGVAGRERDAQAARRGALTSSRNGRAGGATTYGSPGSGPAVQSSIAAVSRTVRLTTCSQIRPLMMSPSIGPSGLRARVGFRPTRPQHEAGMRIEPPPSLACAIGTMPAATAAAEPPLEPPGRVRAGSTDCGTAP